MRTLSRTLQAAAWAALLVAVRRGVLLGAGDEPVGRGGERATGAVHGSDREGAVADRDRGGRADVRVRRGREQADAGRDHLRSRDGDGRGELPGLALLMRGLRRWAGYAALNRPLTILGVERRGFSPHRHARARDVERDGFARDGRRRVRGRLRGRMAGRPQRPGHAWRATGRDALPGAFRPGQVGCEEPWHLVIRSGR